MNRTSKWLVGVAGSLAIGASSAPSHADEKGKALFKEVEKATLAIKTLSGEIQTSAAFGGRNQSSKGAFKIKRPNFLLSNMTGSYAVTYASDGKNLFIYMPDQKQYMKTPADPKGSRLGGSLLQMLFFDPNPARLFGKTEPAFGGTETVGGKTCRVLVLNPNKEQTVRLYVSPENLITLAKIEMRDEKGKVNVSEEEKLVNLKMNALIPDAQFAYAPPKGAKLYEQPSYDAKLLPVNSRAPEFNLATPQGGRISLEKTLKEKKAVLVNFWFYG